MTIARRQLTPMTPGTPTRESAVAWGFSILVTAAAFVCTVGCSSGFARIDRNVDQLLLETTGDMAGEVAPSVQRLSAEPTGVGMNPDPTATRLPTTNPAAAELEYVIRSEAEEVTAKFNDDSAEYTDPIYLDINQAMAYAARNSREYRFAEEEYILAAMRLLIERHLWGPRFFNDTSLITSSFGDDGFFDTSMRIVNEFTVSQRLPYGGQVAATALARATEDLHTRVADRTSQSADLILSAQIPLLRGAGNVAREGRIQAERDVIYQARRFEEFRREFLVSISEDFLNLVVRLQGIENAERQVQSLQWLEQRSRAFVETGRETPLDLALAQQSTLEAIARLNDQREFYRVAVDVFKVRLGMSTDQELIIVRSDPALLPPEVALDDAVWFAMMYRLDLQTRRDQLDDARRRVDIARNSLLPDLDIGGFARVTTDETKRRGGLGFQPQNAEFEASVTFGLPLDREIERINVRQAQIALERAKRDYQRFRDQLAVEVRSAVRNIERAMFSLRIQEENVVIAERGQAAVEADPDRATARDRTDAVERLLRARDERDIAYRDLQIAILRYLLTSGQLRVDFDGTIQPLLGMEFAESTPPVDGPDAPVPPAGG